MGKGRGRNRHKVKKKKTEQPVPSSGSESPAGDCGSPKRKTRSNRTRSRSERTSNASEIYSADSEEMRSNASRCSDERSLLSEAAGPSKRTLPGKPPVQAASTKKPPPITVKNIPFDTLDRELTNLNIPVEFKMSRDSIRVINFDKKGWDATVTYLKKRKAEFFSHDHTSEKPFKSVVRGLPPMDPKKIEQELVTRYKLQPIAIYPMKRKDDETKQFRDQLYLVHFRKGTVTPGALQAVRVIRKIVVKWEPYRGNKNNITQCGKCLNFGHGPRNCGLKPRCNYCSLTHATEDCLTEGAVAFKCANCKGSHQGMDRSCPKREEYRRIRQTASTTNQPRRNRNRPPPPPAVTQQTFPTLQGNTPARAGPPPSNQNWVQASSRMPAPRAARETVAAARSSTPPPSQNASHRPDQPSQQEEASSEEKPRSRPKKYDMEKLMEIFDEMVTKLSACRDGREQVQTLGHFIIKYGC